MKKFIVISFLLFNFCNGQDLNFYSPFITNTYLNPSLAGHQGVTKVSAAYQNNYPNLSSSTVNSFLGCETKLFNKVGLATNFISSDFHRGWMKQNQYILMLNYNIKLSEQFMLTPGVKFNQLRNKLDLSKNHYYNNQWVPYSITTLLYDYTFTSSLLLEHKNFNTGVVLNNFNKPSTNMFNSEIKQESTLTIHSLIKVPIKEQQLNLFLRYDRQGKFNRMQVAAYLNLFKHYQFGLGYFNTDHILFHFGYGNHYFAFNYNYLLTISRLSGNNAVSHELGTAFYIMGKSKRQEFNSFLE